MGGVESFRTLAWAERRPLVAQEVMAMALCAKDSVRHRNVMGFVRGLIKNTVKAGMRACPAIANPIWAVMFPLVRREEFYPGAADENRSQIFEKIYEHNWWGSSESRSGPGSTLAYTTLLRPRLERLLAELKVRTFLDAPCGDFNWMRHVRLPDQTCYVGGDIVAPLINKLQSEHDGPRHSFQVIDIVEGPIPVADLWLCREVLFHLSNKDVLKVLELFSNSSVKYILTTTFDFVRENRDIGGGGIRLINLRLPPFKLPAPVMRIADFIAPAPPRYLALWSREQVRDAIVPRVSLSAGPSL